MKSNFSDYQMAGVKSIFLSWGLVGQNPDGLSDPRIIAATANPAAFGAQPGHGAVEAGEGERQSEGSKVLSCIMAG